jgi:hypothetical protein
MIENLDIELSEPPADPSQQESAFAASVEPIFDSIGQKPQTSE